MSSLTLVVMAAGIGSRYGGLKQMEGFGPGGEVVMEYSVYDALRAGFDRIVFIIRRDFEDLFRERIGKKIEGVTDTAYVFQAIDQVPPGFAVPRGRVKPWGTAQAILACKDAVRSPFAAINADDFYGRSTFEIMARELRRVREAGLGRDFAMMGYVLSNTLSEHGHVARGLCQATPDGYLVNIRELLRIQKFPDGIKAVGSLVRAKKARVKILPTQDRWFGVTYQEDRSKVRAAILELVRRRVYPAALWSAS
jgi:hypothetical protein